MFPVFYRLRNRLRLTLPKIPDGRIAQLSGTSWSVAACLFPGETFDGHLLTSSNSQDHGYRLVLGLLGLLAVGAIYQNRDSLTGYRSRLLADEGRAIANLNTRLSISMLEARRAEKDFQLRREPSYSRHHAELATKISGDFERLKILLRTGGYGAMLEKIEAAQRGFAAYAKDFKELAEAESRLGLNETQGLSGSLPQPFTISKRN